VLTKIGEVGLYISGRRKQKKQIKFWVDSLKGKGQLEYLCENRRIIIIKLIVTVYGKNLLDYTRVYPKYFGLTL
jgi:hypothetical protein